MCGRYAFSRIEKQLIERLGLEEVPPDMARRYNIAPGQRAPVCIDAEDGRELRSLQWGLVPGWSKDPSLGARLINARSESAAEKPAFREAWRQGRCLVPADGWYEWTKEGRQRQPWFIQEAGEGLSCLAGLHEGPAACLDAGHPGTYTILTCPAVPAIGHLHSRMPLLLSPRAQEAWLKGDLELPDLMDQVGKLDLRWHRVSQDVNGTDKDHAGLCEEDLAGQIGLGF